MMTDNIQWIDEIKKRVLSGGALQFEEAMRLIAMEDRSEIDHLLKAAHEITLHYNSTEPSLCSLINAKSNLCSEDCGFCSQSVRYDTRVNQYALMPVEDVVKAAKHFEQRGSESFCVVTSGGELTDAEFEHVLEIYRELKKQTRMNLDGSLGFLTAERVEKLKEAGVRRFNSNLQSSREFYPEIVSTHTYDKRIETLEMLKQGDMEVCSGGIFGMGETREDRVKLAFELVPYEPKCLPVNILNPRPGTPLEDEPAQDPLEMIKTVAVFRFIHPRSSIKLAAGREISLGTAYQELSLMGGANGLIVGGYLTTSGNPMKADFEMLRRAGYQPAKNPDETKEPQNSST